jgi:23S rRNA (adenine2503-C2)-methyltransferase
MLHGVNDTREDLARLPALLRGVPAKVNLIPYNSNAGLGFETPPEEWVALWQRRLHEQGVEVTVRWSKGRDIDAACGQLLTATGRSVKAQKELLVQSPQ